MMPKKVAWDAVSTGLPNGAGNVLADPLPQPSLSECLMLGTAKAHRGDRMGPMEGRNFRRSTPMGNKARVK